MIAEKDLYLKERICFFQVHSDEWSLIFDKSFPKKKDNLRIVSIIYGGVVEGYP